MSDTRPIIDAHLDLAWNALQWNRDLTLPLEQLRSAEKNMTDHPARGRGTVSLPELRRADIRVCLGTLLARAKPQPERTAAFDRREIDFPTQSQAFAVARGQLAYYELLEKQGHIRLIRTRDALQDHWRRFDKDHSPLGVILAMEGADPIVDPEQFRDWWARGLRCIGLAHYARHPYATGTGETGPLTSKGRALLAAMSRAGAILDLTHCAEPGFQEALEIFTGPVLASHCMCRALVPGDRQLSDEQITLIAQRGGLIGMAFDNWMISSSWTQARSREQIPLSAVVDHIDHICQLTGSAAHVCIGSDLDGGYGNEQCPGGMDSIADLQDLSPLLEPRGYSFADIGSIMSGNLLDFLLSGLPLAENSRS